MAVAEKKPAGFSVRVRELIAEKKPYAEANEILKKEYDGVGLAGSSYYKATQKMFPEEEVTGAVEKHKLKKEKAARGRPPKEKVDFAGAQKKADESKLAKILNQGIFLGVPCPNNQLKQEDIDEVNPGGAIVGVLQYYVPQFNPEHPVVVIVLRMVLLVVKIKNVCWSVKKKVEEAVHGEKVAP